MEIAGTVVDTTRQEFLAGISEDALYIADAMRGYGQLSLAADNAAKKRDDFWLEKMANPAFRDRVDRVRDWAATKRDGDVLLIHGKKYTSVKAVFEKEWGVSYEHVRLCSKKMNRLMGLVDGECDTPTMVKPNVTPVATPTPTATTKPNVTPTTETPAPTVEFLSINGRDPKFTMTMRVESAFSFSVSLTEQLTAEEIDEFYTKFIARLGDERSMQNGGTATPKGSGEKI
jgi:hypothetical protein